MLIFIEQQTLESTEAEWRLWKCAKTLLACVQQPSLGSLILTNHLGDLVAILSQISYGSFNQRSPKKIQSEPPFCGSEDTSVIQEKMSSLDPKTASPADFVNVVKGMKNKVEHQDNDSEKPSMCSNPDPQSSKCKEPLVNSQEGELSNAEKTENETLSKGNLSDHGLYSNTSGAENNSSANQSIEASHMKEGADLESCTHNIGAPDIHWCKKELHDLVCRVYPPLVVREMLILQTGMPGET